MHDREDHCESAEKAMDIEQPRGWGAPSEGSSRKGKSPENSERKKSPSDDSGRP